MAILAVLSLGLAADYLFLHVLFPLKQDAYRRQLELREEGGAPLLETPEATPAPPGARGPVLESTPNRPAQSEDFASVLRQCLALSTHAREAKELARELLVLSERTEDVVENWHLRFDDGREERLMVVAADQLQNGGSTMELRHFGVDVEGLPLPIGKKPLLLDESGKRELARTLATGEVFFHQKKQTAQSEGLRADIEWINGELHQLHLVSTAGSFVCAADSCTCL